MIIRPYIYEGDFKGFFDNIKLHYLSRALKELDVPLPIVEKFETLNQSIVKLTGHDLVYEPDRLVALAPNEEINPQ